MAVNNQGLPTVNREWRKHLRDLKRVFRDSERQAAKAAASKIEEER